MNTNLENDEVLTVKVVRAWKNWWFAVGETYQVAKYPYKATTGGTLDKCNCSECSKNRRGKTMHEMYQVASGSKRGNILPVEAVEVVAA